MMTNTRQLELSDTTIRAYKKRSGFISLHLRSHIVIHTDHETLFTQYLSHLKMFMILNDGREIEFDQVGIACAPSFDYELGIETRAFHASTVTNFQRITFPAVRIRLEYQYGDHPMLGVETYERIAPIVKRY